MVEQVEEKRPVDNIKGFRNVDLEEDCFSPACMKELSTVRKLSCIWRSLIMALWFRLTRSGRCGASLLDRAMVTILLTVDEADWPIVFDFLRLMFLFHEYKVHAFSSLVHQPVLQHG